VTPVILLILVGAWVVFLVPALLKRGFERRPTASIESFHHQLDLLERTGLKLVTPAFRLQTARSGTGLAPCQSGYPAVSSMPGAPNLVLLPPNDELADPYPEYPAYEEYSEPAPEHHPHHRMVEPRRRARARRRRNTVGALGVTVVMTGLLGILNPLHPLWMLTIAAGAALFAYVSLAIYAQALMAEQWRAARQRQTVAESLHSGEPIQRVVINQDLEDYDEEYQGLQVLAAAR
jgi:hypothetical protein